MEFVDLSRFAQRLREERIRIGLNQQEFAEAGGVKKNSQVSYEKGATSPTVEYVLAIGRLGVDIGYLITGARQDGDFGIQDRWLIDLVRMLSDRERSAVMQMLLTLSGAAPPTVSIPTMTLQQAAEKFRPEKPIEKGQP